jgi:predicted DNA-binding transcriptional regulator AlpA
MDHPLGLSTIEGRPLPQFHGRKYLRFNELVAIGLVTNRPTLKLLIKRGLFPPPLRLSPRMLLWDVAEIAALVERLRAEGRRAA